MNRLIPLKHTTLAFLAVLLLACFALVPTARAVSPPPDGGYPGFNTAEGTNALFNLNSGGGGIWNTALGGQALFHDTTGNSNTAVGVNALFNNTTGNFNVAIGLNALRLDATGVFNTAVGVNALYNNVGSGNTAIGANALVANTTGIQNVALGQGALRGNTTGRYNTAIGYSALTSGGDSNTAIGSYALYASSGSGNTAIGDVALQGNHGGNHNTAIGEGTLLSNSGGSNNTAIGSYALWEIGLEQVGNGNTAVGVQTLFALGDSPYGPGYGHNNTALGLQAGSYLMRGSGNVYIGAGMSGDSSGEENNHTYIRNISATVLNFPGSDTVTVDLTTGLLGHATSSRRYKEDIKPMDKDSETLYQLKPVTFRYKKEFAVAQSLVFGLIAEEVAEVNPNLVARNVEGQPESIHYEMVNAMLLNEFLKEHRKVEQLEKQVEAFAAVVQKVSAQLELSKSEGKTVLNHN